MDERFWVKVAMGANGCWVWVGSVGANGYGQFWNGARLVPPHRWIYEQVNGPVDAALVMDHLCREPRCVRLDHLEPVTERENIRRGFEARGSDLHCRNGHERTTANTHIRTDGSRYCRTCKNERDRRIYARTA